MPLLSTASFKNAPCPTAGLFGALSPFALAVLVGCPPLPSDTKPKLTNPYSTTESDDSASEGSTGTTADATDDTDTTAGPTGADTTAGDSSDASDSSSTGDPGVCGDGNVDEGEQCDEAGENSNTGFCTLACKIFQCGDGFIFEPLEECDDGNDDDSDGCTSACKLPACGDGHVWDGNEECDQPEPGPAGEVCDACAWRPGRHAFITSVPWFGDFTPDSRDLPPPYTAADLANVDGLAGLELADFRCQQLAALAELPHPDRFVAWLSDNGGLPSSDAVARLKPAPGAYVTPAGTLITADFGDLEGGPEHAIEHTEQGLPATVPNFVWSHTDPAGLHLEGEPNDAIADCDGWTSTAPQGIGSVGSVTDLHPIWTDQEVAKSCAGAYPVYCLEGPAPEEPAP